jgi:transcriptional antiterminator NusG
MNPTIISKDNKWYVVQVLSGKESKTKKNIEDYLDPFSMRQYIEEVLIPMENVAVIRNGKQKITPKKVWPGYLIVKMDMNDISWDYITRSDGVIGFLGGSKPTPLSDGEVSQLLSEIAQRKESVTQSSQYEVGDKVKVTDGVFVNFIGTVTDICNEKGRLSVIVSIFGRETRVDDLQFWQVEHLNEPIEN